MIRVFLGLTITNVLLILTVFGLGIGMREHANRIITHFTLGIAAGLVCTLTHVAVYTYFMATTRWLEAATNKGNLPKHLYVSPAMARKSRAIGLAMAPVAAMMLAMFAGAGADPGFNPLWSISVHTLLATVAIVINLLSAAGEFWLITQQGKLMDKTATMLAKLPTLPAQHA